jgi:hypothetical protein
LENGQVGGHHGWIESCKGIRGRGAMPVRNALRLIAILSIMVTCDPVTVATTHRASLSWPGIMVARDCQEIAYGVRAVA